MLSKGLIAGVAFSMLAGLGLSRPAHAIGCFTGGMAGAVAGHMAHHGVLGAVGGCIAGHEYHKHKVRESQSQMRAQQYQDQGSAGTYQRNGNNEE